MVGSKKRSLRDSTSSSSSTDSLTNLSPPRKKLLTAHKSPVLNHPIGISNKIFNVQKDAPTKDDFMSGNCTKERSHYEKWNSKVDMAEYLPWYRSRDLICVLRTIKKINFNDPKARNGALEKLNGLNDSAPFSKYKRFPEIYFVFEGGGDLSKKMQQLRCVLELSISTADKKEYTPDNMCKIFRSCCTMIIDELVKGDEVYDRKKFEKTFEVTWKEVPPAPPPRPQPDGDDDDRDDPCKPAPRPPRISQLIVPGMKRHCCFSDKSTCDMTQRRKSEKKQRYEHYSHRRVLCNCPKHGTVVTDEPPRYLNWNARSGALQCLSWYLSKDLICAIRTIRKMNFLHTKTRRKALAILNKMNDNAPFSETVRFPEDFYILEEDGPLNRNLQELRALLEISEGGSWFWSKKQPDTDMKALNNKFLFTCRVLMTELVKGDDIYDRAKFEEKFNLKWSEDWTPPPKPKCSSNVDQRKESRKCCRCGNEYDKGKCCDCRTERKKDDVEK